MMSQDACAWLIATITRVTVSHKQPIMLSKKRPLRAISLLTTRKLSSSTIWLKTLSWIGKTRSTFSKINLNLSSSILKKLVMIWVVFYTTHWRHLSWQLWIFQIQVKTFSSGKSLSLIQFLGICVCFLRATIVRLRLLYKITQLIRIF